jgi:hypothetical protein
MKLCRFSKAAWVRTGFLIVPGHYQHVCLFCSCHIYPFVKSKKVGNDLLLKTKKVGHNVRQNFFS